MFFTLLCFTVVCIFLKLSALHLIPSQTTTKATHTQKKKSYVQGSTEGLSVDERKNIKPSMMVPYL